MSDIVMTLERKNLENTTNENQWKRTCPECRKDLFYTSKVNLNRAIKRGGVCNKCAYVTRGKMPWNKGIKTGPLTSEQKEKHRKAMREKYEPYRYCYTILKNQAKYRKLECLLTFDEFLKFTKIKQCEYCGDDIVWEEHITNTANRGGYNLDRKDNALGYSESNCIVCCQKCNAMKSDNIPYELMIRIGKVIKEYREENR